MDYQNCGHSYSYCGARFISPNALFSQRTIRNTCEWETALSNPTNGSLVDEAFEAANRIFLEAASNLDQIHTEEDAKVQIITRLLTESLGWMFGDINCERKHDSGYSDYVLSDNQLPSVLLEAKRAGTVNINAQEKGRLKHYKISGPALTDTIPGIDQAASYAAPNGLPFAVLTDGIAWIVFKTFVPGENFKSKPAFVFPSMDAVQADFSVFYDLLAKEQVRKKLYNGMFDAIHHNRLLLSRTLVAPIEESEIRIQQKSALAFDLDRVFGTFFSKLAGDEDEDLLIECFVETRESRIADFALEKITANVLGNLSPVEKDVDRELASLIESAVDVESGRTIFIVGPTGAGKSTFLDRFFKKTLSQPLRNRCVVCRVNYLDFSGAENLTLSWLTEHMIKQFERHLYTDGSPTWNELLGLYHSEYDRRARGVDAQLYATDPSQFKIKFGEFLERMVESDREGYLKRILSDIIRNRKKLPIVVIDNTDEFTLDNKKNIFQFAQSMARHANHCLLIFPVTDKSAWSFSKTDIFSIYQSLSFYLPTPSPREVFRRRVDFLKRRLSEVAAGGQKKEYFTGRGINISIKNLDGFAVVLERVFVDHDYTSRTLGELTNYNIRRTLLLSKRVITSSVLRIEDLLKSFILGEFSVPSFAKFMNALMKGDYDAYRKGDDHNVYPVFQVDPEIRQSPLLTLRILVLLDTVRKSGRSIDERHLGLVSIFDYFDAMGCAEVAVDRALLALSEAALIDPFDASVRNLSPGQRFSISFSGAAHLKLATHNDVFFEQMALTTSIVDEDVANRIRAAYRSNASYQTRMSEVRRAFMDYLKTEDSSNLTIPEGAPQYECQLELTDLLTSLAHADTNQSGDVAESLGSEFAEGTVKEAVTATVDWFDSVKGYGFVDVDGIGGVFLHASKLQDKGLGSIHDGDEILCDISRDQKGLHVSRVRELKTDPAAIEIANCRVIRLYAERGYGFVRVGDSPRDAFFHFSLIAADSRELLTLSTIMHAEVGPDNKGRGLQVRRVLALH
jgi:cold shock CspA family protein/predicted type IV restriction endonuclease/GTPase SAR1 family protein